MRIGGRREKDEDGAPKGPWSDLPPPPPSRPDLSRPRRPAREPFIANWRGLVIVLFLLIVAPFLARWASAVILSLLPGH